ncbi:MAG: hypothetical protein IPG89_04995 [Bacteroidetes bacterium]|nr:hypothetical protein [Bacteroidota bacterium]
MNANSYRWTKYKNGISSVAVVSINVESYSVGPNTIIENYSGQGFNSQGAIESVPPIGYESWKIAAKHGLEYAFSLTKDNWKVTINSIEGRSVTDTTPSVVAYTIFRAFCDKINLTLSEEVISKLEEFVLSAWTNPYKELIPDFYTLTFSE